MMILEGKYKIFVIDDSVFVRNLLMELLPDLGFEIVGMAESAKDAFRYVADTKPDVILLDVSLQGITTEDVIKGLLSINRNLEIIILAPLSNQRDIMDLLRYGARDFIPKPLVPEQIEYVLRVYELSSGIRPTTEIQAIAQIQSIFYNELIKHAPENVYKLVTSSVYMPIKRLNKKYPDRYDNKISPVRINLKLAKGAHSQDIYKMYKLQLDRLYHSIANKMQKEFPKEYVNSYLLEAYQTFYPLASYLIETTKYNLPVWGDLKLEYYDQKYALRHSRVKYLYQRGSQLKIPEGVEISPNIRLEPYRIVINHDPRLAPKFPRPDLVDIDNFDIHILLSYFDDIIGPKAAIIIPQPHGRIEKDKLQSIPKIMDFAGANPNDPFIHTTGDYGSINVVFSVPLDVRGGVRDYMLSVVISPVEIREMIKLNKMTTVLRATIAEIGRLYQQQPELARQNQISKLSTEPQEIISDLLDEVRDYLQKT
ncbi:MAG: response regulator [Candidatus Heimdallarchaeota archaeon]|nr:response regulator [Candidatus Heimdallarchaeota archaeon]MDH5646017.1 response regulator [Candidatus Heimdallarchaeota archaeon]